MTQLELNSVARALGGSVIDGAVSCPGPNHSRRDLSLRVILDPQAPDGFRVHSFAGDDWRACRDHVCQSLRLSSDRRLSGGSTAQNQCDTDKRDYARRIWAESQCANGTPVEAYLNGRGLLFGSVPKALHFHGSCPFKGDRVKAMIAPMTNIVTGDFQGVHRTKLEPKDKAMLGPATSFMSISKMGIAEIRVASRKSWAVGPISLMYQGFILPMMSFR